MKRQFVRSSLILLALLLALNSTEAFGAYEQFVFSGEIDFVLVNDSPTILTGFGVGTTVNGTFGYGVDDSDASVIPHGDNETDYQFSGLPYGAVLDSTVPAADFDEVTVVVSDNSFIGGSILTELGQILGITIQDGDPFDGWTVRTDEEPVSYVAMGVTFFAFTDTGLLNDENYRPTPPAGVGPGGFDGAVFRVLETDAAGRVTFMGIGEVDSYEALIVPEPASVIVLALGALAMLKRRR